MPAKLGDGDDRRIFGDPLPFPREIPPEYASAHAEPEFDPKRHLALEPPLQKWLLSDFGYSAAEIARCASKLAVAGPFRLLSVEGVAAARSVALSLRPMSRTSNRTANYLAGGVYRSKFLRDLCECSQILEFLSEIADCSFLPHTMPSQQLYINYAPEDLAQAVDSWHADSIGFDYVLLLNDPATLVGGQFQFFRGTIDEVASLWGTEACRLTEATKQDLPPERVVSPDFPAAGYAVFQQGNMVVHRASRLTKRAERITLVPGQVARDVRFPDPTKDRVARHGEHGILAEFARHKAWRTQAKLADFIDGVRLGTSAEELRDALQTTVADVQRAIDVLAAIAQQPDPGQRP